MQIDGQGRTEAYEETRADATIQAVPVADEYEVVSLIQAARLAGVSPATIQRRISEGELPATRDGRAWRIRKSVVLEVGQTARKRDPRSQASHDRGILAAKVFPMLAAGTPLDEIVVQLSADPKQVRELFEEWCRCRALSASMVAPAAQATGPTFDHQPNSDWTCCGGHKAAKRMQENR